MTRHATAAEVRLTLARLARMAPDDLDGYVIVLARGADVDRLLTNARDEATTIGLLARAIEQRAQAVGQLEDKLELSDGRTIET